MPPIRRTTYLLALILLGVWVGSLVWHPAPPPKFVGIASSDIPAQIGTWTSMGDDDIPPEVSAALASADIVSRTYRGSSIASPPINFILIGGTDRNALHDPRSCLIGAGWRLENDRVEDLPKDGITVRACDAVGESGGIDYDIVYLYDVDGHIRNKETEIRLEMLFSALIGRRNRPVYFLRFLLPRASDPGVRAANHKLLLQFAADSYQALSPKIGVSQ